MSQRRKGQTPVRPDADDDSLDFSEIGPSRASPAEPAPVDNQPARPQARRRRSTASRTKAGAFEVKPERRRIGLILIVLVALAIAAYVVNDRVLREPEAPARQAKPAPPPFQVAPAQKPAQAPSAKAPPKAAPQAAAPTIPPDFMKAFKDYEARPGSKAIALALDRSGRWAFGIIAGHATQKDANEEALAECARFKAQSGVQENCRLYASGDKVVW